MRKDFEGWKTVRSATGYGKDGFPMGEFLVRSDEALKEILKNIDEPITRKFEEKKGE